MENRPKERYFKKRQRAFRHAWDGILCFPKEPHAKIHLVSAALVLILALVLKVSRTEWFVLLLCIALVLLAEILNSAFERLCDALHPEQHQLIKEGKDLAAGAVLICSGCAAAIGLFIFGTKLLSILEL